MNGWVWGLTEQQQVLSEKCCNVSLVLRWIMFSNPQTWKSCFKVVSFNLTWVYIVTDTVVKTGSGFLRWSRSLKMWSDFFQNWVQYNSKLTLTLFELTLLESRPTIDDFSKFPQGVDFSPSRLIRAGSILNRGIVESSAVPNLHVDDLLRERRTSAAWVLSGQNWPVIQSPTGGYMF